MQHLAPRVVCARGHVHQSDPFQRNGIPLRAAAPVVMGDVRTIARAGEADRGNAPPVFQHDFAQPLVQQLQGRIGLHQRHQQVLLAAEPGLSGDFQPEEYTDSYREALEAVVRAKAEGVPLEAEPEVQEQAEVVDLVAALRASVEAAKKRRAEAGEAKAV